MVDTGDIVKHEPTGEMWLVAFVKNDKLCPCGWPESLADLSDCHLITAASDDDRKSLLEEMANGSENDSRTIYAKNKLLNNFGQDFGQKQKRPR
jgi:hypothetical protein